MWLSSNPLWLRENRSTKFAVMTEQDEFSRYQGRDMAAASRPATTTQSIPCNDPGSIYYASSVSTSSGAVWPGASISGRVCKSARSIKATPDLNGQSARLPVDTVKDIRRADIPSRKAK